MAIKFEKVKRFADADIQLPNLATPGAAGYDFYCAEDIIIPSYYHLMNQLLSDASVIPEIFTLKQMEELTKKKKARPTLISTGVKCKLEDNTYLELCSRSSTPLKYWIICGNGQGIIDSDYYENPSNDGEIFFQAINLSPFPILIKKGDRICQGIIKEYLSDDKTFIHKKRMGGFGSSND